MCILEWTLWCLCRPECAGRADPYPERGHKNGQRHWWRRACGHIPRVYSLEGGSSQPQGFLVSAVKGNVFEMGSLSFWHFSLFSSPLQKSKLFEHGIRRLTFLVAQKVRALFSIYKINYLCPQYAALHDTDSAFLNSMSLDWWSELFNFLFVITNTTVCNNIMWKFCNHAYCPVCLSISFCMLCFLLHLWWQDFRKQVNCEVDQRFHVSRGEQMKWGGVTRSINTLQLTLPISKQGIQRFETHPFTNNVGSPPRGS